MRDNSHWRIRQGTDHTAMVDGDKVLPPLRCVTLREQGLLQSIPYLLALLCAVLTTFDNFRYGMILLLLVIFWSAWRCPWRRKHRASLPLALGIQEDGSFWIEVSEERQESVYLSAQPFLHARLGVIPLRNPLGQKRTFIVLCPARRAGWRQWRLLIEREWDARVAPSDRVG
jgi:hypothetical protein